MKRIKYIILLLIMIPGMAIYGQDLKDSDVPVVVKNTFRKVHPNMFVYEWEWKKKCQCYEAEFKNKGMKHKAYFDKNGNWQHTRVKVDEDAVPGNIHSSFARSSYQSWKTDDITIYHFPDSVVQYEIEVKKGKQKKYLYFSASGDLQEVR
jgi:hypothetical protein